MRCRAADADAGAEFIDNLHQDQQSRYLDPFEYSRQRRVSTQQAAYLQDEIKLTRWLIVNGGLRYDRLREFQRVTPRAALIVMPSSTQSFKYLYGRAFRAPERLRAQHLLFRRPHRRTCDPRRSTRTSSSGNAISTTGCGRRCRLTGTTRTNLITLIPDAVDLLRHRRSSTRARCAPAALELEAQMRLKAGIQGLMSYALQRAENVDTGAALVNSPGQMAKVRFSVPGPLEGFVPVGGGPVARKPADDRRQHARTSDHRQRRRWSRRFVTGWNWSGPFAICSTSSMQTLPPKRIGRTRFRRMVEPCASAYAGR